MYSDQTDKNHSHLHLIAHLFFNMPPFPLGHPTRRSRDVENQIYCVTLKRTSSAPFEFLPLRVSS